MPTINSQDLLHQIKITGKIPELVHGILQQRILEMAAKELKIEISDQELQEGADRFRAANKIETAQATQQWLADRLLSMDDFEQLITTNLLVSKVANKLFFDRAAPYFYEHILDYAAAVIYQVILTDQNLAWELFYAIQEGDMTFGEIAKIYASDIESQRRGGYLGNVLRQKMDPAVSAAVFAAEPAQILKPIVVGTQVYLILVEEVTPATLTPALQDQIMWQLFHEWLQDQIGSQRSSLTFV
jgi:parvulin-like peptidyl-prolyl isomerase